MDVPVFMLFFWVAIILLVTAAYLYKEKKKREHKLTLARARGVVTAEQKDVGTSQVKEKSRKAFPWKILAVTIIVITIVAALAAVWYVQSTNQKLWRTILWLRVRDDDAKGRAPHYTSDAFVVTGDEWRINWIIEGEWDTFSIEVADSYTENVIREINATANLLDNKEVLDYFNVKGRFYLDFTVTPPATVDYWQWTAYVQDYR
jgi:hypothetical protein